METATLLIALLVLGAVGLLVALPGGRTEGGTGIPPVSRIGLVLAAAAGGVLVATGLRAVVRDASLGWFIGCALVALFAAVRVITHRRPVYSALYFVLLVVAVAALLVLMEAQFLAAALVIVYAGAILVTYVFVIMLAQQSRPAPYDAESREPLWGCLAGFALLTAIAAHAELFLAPGERTALPPPLGQTAGTVEAVGTRLLTEYIVAIQMAGLLLLAALVGAIAIARRRAATAAQTEGED